MKQYRPYVNHLQKLLSRLFLNESNLPTSEDVHRALDGEPNRKLRELLPKQTRHSSGAFFTGKPLSERAISLFSKSLDVSSVVLDPACGAGDLLLASNARVLQSLDSADLALMISRLSEALIGQDVEIEFVRVARLRLLLQTIFLADIDSWSQIAEKFFKEDKYACSIKRGNSLMDENLFSEATHIVVNPPFSLIDASENCLWATGKVNAAAVFIEKCVTYAKPGTHIVAILPDVLRSGIRYEKWRNLVGKLSTLRHLEIYGQFDENTEVEVFLAEFIMESSKTTVGWMPKVLDNQLKLSDMYQILVGPVVDYRDKHIGEESLFLRVCDLPPWKEIQTISRKRRFSGRLITPPFVAIRRTSRANDAIRAVATIVRGHAPIAVENHLLIVKPHDGTLRSCRFLMSVLRTQETSDWLNDRIRCRHLSKSVLCELPIFPEKTCQEYDDFALASSRCLSSAETSRIGRDAIA